MRFLTVIFSFLTYVSVASPFTIYTSKDGLINTQVNCIEKGENFIWIGTNAGLNRVVFDGVKPVKFSPRGTSVPVTALEDDGKVIWVGLKGKGVYMMPKENYKFIGFRKDVLGDKEVVGIQKVEGGLVVYTATTKYTFKFDSEKYQSAGMKFQQGDWIGFSAGGKELIKNEKGILERYNQPTKSTRKFDKQIIANAYLLYQNGALIASPSGLVYYDPSKDKIQFGEPTVMLSGFMLNGEDTVADNLDLNWDEYVFKYQFDFTELGDPENITLSYNLKGAGVQISDSVTATNGIEIKDLEHGDYELTVSAVNSKGVNAKNTLTYKFSIANPLKDSIWQYLIWGTVALIWTVIVVLLTRSKFKKDILVLEDALLEKTNKLNQIEKGKYGLVDEDKVNL